MLVSNSHTYNRETWIDKLWAKLYQTWLYAIGDHKNANVFKSYRHLINSIENYDESLFECYEIKYKIQNECNQNLYMYNMAKIALKTMIESSQNRRDITPTQYSVIQNWERTKAQYEYSVTRLNAITNIFNETQNSLFILYQNKLNIELSDDMHKISQRMKEIKIEDINKVINDCNNKLNSTAQTVQSNAMKMKEYENKTNLDGFNKQFQDRQKYTDLNSLLDVLESEPRIPV